MGGATPGAYMDNERTEFSFSEPFLKAYLLENARGHGITGSSVVLNLGKGSIDVAGNKLVPLSSSVYSNVTIEKAEKLV